MSDGLVVERVSLDQIEQDPKNVRKHDNRNLTAIANSLQRFGQQKPIVIDANGIILAGNGTYLAAQELGWDSLDAVRSTLEGTEGTAYSIADNKTTDLSEWEYEKLSEVLGELRDQEEALLMSTGFADFEIEPLLAAEWSPPAIEELPTVSNGDEDTDSKHVVGFSEDQWETVSQAIRQLRESRDAEEIPAGTAIEIICSEYLS